MGSSTAGPSSTTPSRGRSIAERGILVIIILVLLLALDGVALAFSNPAQAFGAKHYYMAMGDSIGFGYQPDLNFTSGYVDDVFNDLRKNTVSDEANLSCSGETTTTMIYGNCQLRLIHHDAYTGAQLAAAVKFLNQHQNQVGPITLDIGVNDVFNDWNSSTCTASSLAQQDLTTMDTNITTSILPTLQNTLGGPAGLAEAHLVMLNYYNPFAQQCPNSNTFVGELNAHIAQDAAKFNVPVVDVYNAFGGDAHMADNVCSYTWYCNAHYHDIHPTTTGYSVMAKAVEQMIAYAGSGGSHTFPALPFMGGLIGFAPHGSFSAILPDRYAAIMPTSPRD